jgi:hypothetical protein
MEKLINAFMKLVSKAGGGSLIRDMIQQVDESGNPKVWTPSEVEAAVHYVNEQIDNFGTAEATIIVETLVRKYNLRLDTFQRNEESLSETHGIQGLQ